MRLRSLVGALLCTGLLSSIALAQRPAWASAPWRDLGVGSAGRVLLDTAHLVRDSVGLRVHMRFTSSETFRVRDARGNVLERPTIYDEIDTYIDCTGRRVWEKQVSLLDSAGNRRSGFTPPGTTWSNVSRPTAQLYFDLACAGLAAANKH